MLWAVGPTALFAPGPDATALALAFVVVGGGCLAILFGLFGRVTVRSLRATVPHLVPFGSLPLDVALYALVFAVVTCSTHAFFDVFTGADNGGQVDGLANQRTLSYVLLAASIVVYLATTFAVLLIARVVRLGRQIDLHRNADPYRVGPPTPDEWAEPPLVPARRPAPPPSPFARPLVCGVSILVGVGMSAVAQLFEANLQPASAADWLASQAFTPIWALGTAWGLAYLDSGVRRLESRYVLTVLSAQSPVAGPGSTGIRCGAVTARGAGNRYEGHIKRTSVPRASGDE